MSENFKTILNFFPTTPKRKDSSFALSLPLPMSSYCSAAVAKFG